MARVPDLARQAPRPGAADGARSRSRGLPGHDKVPEILSNVLLGLSDADAPHG